MTISITKTRTTKVADGTTTAFGIDDSGQGIYFADASEISVQLRDGDVLTPQTQGSDFTVSGAGTAAGTVTFVTAPTDALYIDIWRTTPRTQILDLSAGANYNAVNVESTFDRIVRMLQEVEDGGGAGSGGFSDDHALTLEAGGNSWDGESKRLSNITTGSEDSDAVTVAQLNAAIAGEPVVRTITESSAIAQGEHLVAANPLAIVVSIVTGVTWCMVSAASSSAAAVTVVSADGPTTTIEDDGTGVSINANVGPVLFIKDPADADNYITVVPYKSAGAAATEQRWRGNLTVTALNALTDAEAGQGGYATDGRKNGEGASSGTGVQVFHDGSNWIAIDTGATVAA